MNSEVQVYIPYILIFFAYYIRLVDHQAALKFQITEGKKVAFLD